MVGILRGLYLAFCDLCESQFEFLLFVAVTLVMFFGAFRLGELLLAFRHAEVSWLLLGLMFLLGREIVLFVSPKLTKGVMGLELDSVGPPTLSYAQLWLWRITDNAGPIFQLSPGSLSVSYCF